MCESRRQKPEDERELNPLPELEYHQVDIDVTESQKKLIQEPICNDEILEVIAGPGSGKTTSLVHKILYMIGELGILPNEILVLSLTNRAVGALREKLNSFTGSDIGVDITTFHSFCHRTVNEYDQGFKDFQLLEEAGWRLLLSQLTGKGSENVYHLKKFVEALKNEKYGLEETCAKFRIKKSDAEKILNTLDKSKVILHSEIIRNAKKILSEVDLGYKVVIVDEFQDIHVELFEIVELIAKNCHLIVASDPYQSIYKFMGNNYFSIKKLHEFKPIKRISLSHSFRSSSEILELSDEIVEREVSSIPVRGASGVKPIFHVFDSSKHEYDWICQEIQRLTEDSDGFIQYNDICVLGKDNRGLNNLKKSLNFYEIANYQLTSNPSWFEGDLYHLLDYLKIVFYPSKSDFSILCTLRLLHGVGPTKILKLHNEATKSGQHLYHYLSDNYDSLPPQFKKYYDTLEGIRACVDLNDHRDVYEKLLQASQKLGLLSAISSKIKKDVNEQKLITAQLLDFYESLKLCKELYPDSTVDTFLKRYNEFFPVSRTSKAVKLSTIHSAKGLEFPIVFILGSFFDREYDEETQRLLYVAMTRAKNLLYINSTEPERKLFSFGNSPRMDHAVFRKRFGGLIANAAPQTNTVSFKSFFKPATIGALRGLHTMICSLKKVII